MVVTVSFFVSFVSPTTSSLSSILSLLITSSNIGAVFPFFFLPLNASESNGFISEVKHKSFLEVNEEGSEAAAATSVAITKNAISRPTRFVADRPFFFTITESNSNLILFMGSVLDI